MNNVTVTLDDELYRRTRIFAAEADTTVTAVVRDFLVTLQGESAKQQQSPDELIEAALKKVRQNHPRFGNDPPLSPEAVYESA